MENDSLPLLYTQTASTDTLLARDSLLFNDQIEGFGMAGRTMPDVLWREDAVTVILFAALFMMLLFMQRDKGKMRERLRNFFFPSNVRDPSKDEKPHAGLRHAFFILLCSLLIAIIGFLYLSHTRDLFLLSLSRLSFLGVLVGCTTIYFALKYVLYTYVHSVFFSHDQCSQWNEAASILFVMEASLLFPLALIAVFFDLEWQHVAYGLLFVVIFVKLPLLWKSRSIFFPNLHCTFHLILYFCALEAAPLLALLAAMVSISDHLRLP